MTVRRTCASALLLAGAGIGCLQIPQRAQGTASAGEQCFAEAPLTHRASATPCATNVGDCQQDSDCASQQICSCSPSGASNGLPSNRCLPGNCLVDADCACGYCSPSEGTYCIYRAGYVGFYCHTKADACLNNSDCDAGLCEYNPMLDHWACATDLFCNG